MRLWAGAAHFRGYGACVSVHYAVAATEKEAKEAVLAEASKEWPEWWHNYPYEVYVREVPDKMLHAVADEDLR